MPKRTTPRQKAIALLHRILAEDGWQVEESAMLVDGADGTEREVDVIVKGDANGVPLVIAVEVYDQSRPASVTWVEQIWAKHQHLPTDKLVLVSWSGFTKGARAKGSIYPRVALVAPTDRPGTWTLYAQEISLRLEDIRLEVETPTKSGTLRGEPDFQLRFAGGTSLALLDHVLVVLNVNRSAHDLLVLAADHDEETDLAYFTVGWQSEAGTHLYDEEKGQAHAVSGVSVSGPFQRSQAKVDLRSADLNGLLFGYGTATLRGREAHVVLLQQTDERAGAGVVELAASPPSDAQVIPLGQFRP